MQLVGLTRKCISRRRLLVQVLFKMTLKFEKMLTIRKENECTLNDTIEITSNRHMLMCISTESSVL